MMILQPDGMLISRLSRGNCVITPKHGLLDMKTRSFRLTPPACNSTTVFKGRSNCNQLSKRRHLSSKTPTSSRTDRDQIHVLPDGRHLGFAFYGETTSKRSLFYLHGLPGSRVEAIEWDAAASHQGIRIIALDRPGYGLSTLNPGRRLSKYPEDVLSLANHLGLETFDIIGMSGGGPYVLSCAAAVPASRLRSVGVIAGLAPPNIKPLGGDLGPRTTRYLLRYFPNLIAQLSDSRFGKLARMEDPVPMQEMWYKGFKHYRGADENIITSREYSNLMADLFREAFKQGWRGFAEDGKLINRKWDFKLEDIDHRNVSFHYADKDVHTPPHMGMEMQKRVKGSRYLEYKDATHLNLVHVHAKAILGDIVRHL